MGHPDIVVNPLLVFKGTAHFMPIQAPELVAEEIDRAYQQN
jgi:hypothetical protein